MESDVEEGGSIVQLAPLRHRVLAALAALLLPSTTIIEVSLPAVHEVHTSGDHDGGLVVASECMIDPTHPSFVGFVIFMSLMGVL